MNLEEAGTKVNGFFDKHKDIIQNNPVSLRYIQAWLCPLVPIDQRKEAYVSIREFIMMNGHPNRHEKIFYCKETKNGNILVSRCTDLVD